MRRIVPVLSLVLAGCAPAEPAQAPSTEQASGTLPDVHAHLVPQGPRHPFTVDNLLAAERIGGPSVSPDGKLVVFTVAVPDLGANKLRKDLYLAATSGAFVRRLTSHPEADQEAVFAPDGKSILFLSSRSGSSQVWRIAVDGGEASRSRGYRSTSSGMLPFPDGKRLLLVLSVYPDAQDARGERGARRGGGDIEEPRARLRRRCRCATGTPGTTASAAHLFVFTDGSAEPKDLMPGLPYDAPPKPFGGTEEIAISRDGASVVFTSKMVGREDAWSTNSDLWVVPADGSAAPRSLTRRQSRRRTRRPSSPGTGRSSPIWRWRDPGSSRTAIGSFSSTGRATKARPRLRRGVVKTWEEGAHRGLGSLAAQHRLLGRREEPLRHRRQPRARRALLHRSTARRQGGRRSSTGHRRRSALVAGAARRSSSTTICRHPDEVWIADAAAGTRSAITHLNDAKVARSSGGRPSSSRSWARRATRSTGGS